MILTYSKSPININCTRNNGHVDVPELFQIKRGEQVTEIPDYVAASDEFKLYESLGHFKKDGPELTSHVTELVYSN